VPVPVFAAFGVAAGAAAALRAASQYAGYRRRKLSMSMTSTPEQVFRAHVIDDEGNVRQDRLEFSVEGMALRVTGLSVPGEYHVLISTPESGRQEYRYSTLNDRFWAT
jgi:hypothetical protein